MNTSFDCLEPRRLLASNFASVGLGWAFETGGEFDVGMVATEGTLEDDLTVSGSLFRDEEFERDRVDDLWYDSIIRLSGGRFDRDPPLGFLGSPVERNGVRFEPAAENPVGWWLSEYSGSEDIELLLTVDPDVDHSAFEATYQYTTIGFDDDENDAFLSTGRMIIDDEDVRWSASRGTAHRTQSDLDFQEPSGALVTIRHEYIYLSADGSTVVYADMSTGDELTALGVATRPASTIDEASAVGVYLTLYATGSGGRLDFRQLAIELEADGDYKFYDLDEYDDGVVESIERGFWRISGDRIVLEEPDSGIERSFVIGENGSTLLATEVADDTQALPIFALGVKVVPEVVPEEVILNVPARDALDRPQIFQLETDDVWYVADVISDIGGPTPIGDVVSWVDPKDGLSYGAAVTSQWLVLYTESAEDEWSYRNLTLEATGGDEPAGELAVMISPDGLVHLTALGEDGDLLHYSQTGVQEDDGDWRWTFENISEEDLDPNGIATPDFSGLVSYATAWGGLNVAGLDDAGNIWGVWWAPGRPRWSVSNLTSAYGADPLAGGLTVYLTPWSGINIAGIDEEGRLRVTWWVPRFGGEWAQSDLTELTGGPLYEPETLGSFVSSWGGLNIIGANRDTGEVVVTWWAPANSGHGWRVTSLSDAVPAGSPVIAAPYTGIAATDSSLNVFGYAGTDFVRYFWEPGFGGNWEVQNLTDIAVMR